MDPVLELPSPPLPAPALKPEPKSEPKRAPEPTPDPAPAAEPAPEVRPRRRRLHGVLLTLAWFLVVVAAAGALVAPWTSVVVPSWVPLAGAVCVTTAYAYALGVRTGGRPLISGLLALVLSAAAAISGAPVLLAGATVCTVALGAVLGVLSTTPAARFVRVVGECLVATAVAAVAAFAATAYDAPISLMRAGYLALALGLLGALLIVFRLGAGLQGLGTRGVIVVVGGLVLLAVSLAYTEALARWGSPGVIEGVDQTARRVHDVLGAVPRPIAFLLGFPALAWGVSTRARRRQGWWACGFGAAALVVVGMSLLRHRAALAEAGLGVGYALVVGLLLGYLVIRVDAFLTGTRGRRARRAEEASAARPEPRRTAPLL